jgi:8-oxo-dGTP pyrophosphatase MutT (NUDIX family)
MALSEKSAGGIIFRTRDRKIELCLIRDNYGVWTFPKGKVEAGETEQQAALREVGEEVGITRVHVVAPAGASRYRFPAGDGICHKTVHWFLMEVPADVECTPAAAEHVQDAAWFTPERALSTIGYRNLRPVLRRALQMLA